MLNSPPKPHPFISLPVQSSFLNTYTSSLNTYILGLNTNKAAQALLIRVIFSTLILFCLLAPIRAIIDTYTDYDYIIVKIFTGAISYAFVSLSICFIVYTNEKTEKT